MSSISCVVIDSDLAKLLLHNEYPKASSIISAKLEETSTNNQNINFCIATN